MRSPCGVFTMRLKISLRLVWGVRTISRTRPATAPLESTTGAPKSSESARFAILPQNKPEPCNWLVFWRLPGDFSIDYPTQAGAFVGHPIFYAPTFELFFDDHE